MTEPTEVELLRYRNAELHRRIHELLVSRGDGTQAELVELRKFAAEINLPAFSRVEPEKAERCKRCGGDGMLLPKAPNDDGVRCPDCDGKGFTVYGASVRTACYACSGTGREKPPHGMFIHAKPVEGVGDYRPLSPNFRPAGGLIELINQATAQQESDSLLRPVWRDGKFLARDTFADVRARLARASSD